MGDQEFMERGIKGKNILRLILVLISTCGNSEEGSRELA